MGHGGGCAEILWCVKILCMNTRILKKMRRLWSVKCVVYLHLDKWIVLDRKRARVYHFKSTEELIKNFLDRYMWWHPIRFSYYKRVRRRDQRAMYFREKNSGI